MYSKKSLIFILGLIVFSLSFSIIGNAYNSWCPASVGANLICGDFSGWTIEWANNSSFTGLINKVVLGTLQTWSAGGTYDISKTFLWINGTNVSTPTFSTSDFIYKTYWTNTLVWDGLNIPVNNGNVIFELYMGATGSNCGIFGHTAGIDVDCDGDARYGTNNGNTLNGIYNQTTASIGYDLIYYYEYSAYNPSARSVATSNNVVSYSNVNLSGYYTSGGVTNQTFVGFNLSKNASMTNQSSYTIDTIDTSGFFYTDIANLDSYTIYYYRAFGQDLNDSIWYEGSILSFETRNLEDINTYIRVYDLISGNRLGWYHRDYTGTITGDNYFYGTIWINGLEWWIDKTYFTQTETIEISGGNWLNGQSKYITITGVYDNEPQGKVDGLSVTWDWYNTAFIMYYGNTYDLFLSRTEGINETDAFDYYDALLGDNYMVFYGYEKDCFYGVNSFPKIIFNLTDDNVSQYNEYYRWIIRKAHGGITEYTTGIIDMTGVDYKRGIIDVLWWSFPTTGEYWIALYNCTASLEKNLNIFYSPVVTVCTSGSGGGGSGGGGSGGSGIDTGIGFIIPNLRGTMWGGLIGAIIVGICMIIPMRIQKGLHMKQKLPSFIYVFMGALGVVIATILPFFDVWVIAFLVIISFLYIGARYLLKSGSVEAEE